MQVALTFLPFDLVAGASFLAGGHCWFALGCPSHFLKFFVEQKFAFAGPNCRKVLRPSLCSHVAQEFSAMAKEANAFSMYLLFPFRRGMSRKCPIAIDD